MNTEHGFAILSGNKAIEEGFAMKFWIDELLRYLNIWFKPKTWDHTLPGRRIRYFVPASATGTGIQYIHRFTYEELTTMGFEV